ncbi:hypothetical protein INR49_029171, partial [Caranx melampygus]
MPRKGKCAQAVKLRWRKPDQEKLPSHTVKDHGDTTPLSLEHHSQVHSSGDWMMCVPTFVHWMTSVPTVKMQTKLLVPTSSITKEQGTMTTDQEGRPPEDHSKSQNPNRQQ